jgi:aminopeptidase N
MKKIFFLISLSFLLFHQNSKAQTFTKQDTLRGSITKERAWWNLMHYTLKVKIDAEKKYISGSNTIQYEVLENYASMQIDLQDPLKITKVIQDNDELSFTKTGNAYFIKLIENQAIGAIKEITVFYEGNPVESMNPPWSGGFTWKKDSNGNDFIATSCQGIGASIWWPNKDHMYDEPEKGASIYITPPKNVMAVSNGRLNEVIENKDGTKTYHWEVVNPINNYGINVNIGDYVHFSDKFQGENGALDCDYYVLSYNIEKAKEQFQQAPKMLEAFEHWFGPYPFYEDSYKLVEVPYLGMEHQSSVTYGNQFKNGYLGRDLSRTGWGLKFDFIIIHESGHEWFANNITYKDIADMWIHEGFTAYSEALYVDYYFGTEAGNDYVIGTRKNIKNKSQIIGKYNVNHEGSGDMYPKAANMLHTYRQFIIDDTKFRAILRGLNADFYHQTVTTEQIENYLSEKANLNLTVFFDQYLRTIQIPVLEYKKSKNGFSYRFTNVVNGFSIPVKVWISDKEKWVTPTADWQEIKVKESDATFTIDRNFYVIHSEVGE